MTTPQVDENRARAAAGLTMALGAIAFCYAYFDQIYWPLRVVSVLFAVDFLIRVTVGLSSSPAGVLAGLLTRRHRPEWVSVRPKRLAWSLGLAMSSAMAVITNSGVHGWLPRSICLICIVLMWLEAVLGLCLGCELHVMLVARGWARGDDPGLVCGHGACEGTQAVR
jgi:hypothetical protein